MTYTLVAMLISCAANLPVQGRSRARRGGGAMPPLQPLQGEMLIRCLLLLDVLANHGYGCAAATSGKIRGGPERPAP